MAHYGPPEQQFYGSTTIGEKGQVVIPADARKALKLTTGDKLLVFGMGRNVIAFAKIEELAKFEKHLSDRLNAIRKAVRAER